MFELYFTGQRCNRKVVVVYGPGVGTRGLKSRRGVEGWVQYVEKILEKMTRTPHRHTVVTVGQLTG